MRLTPFTEVFSFAFRLALLRGRLYFDRGGDPNQADSDSFTALHFACNGGHRDVVDQLIQHRAEVNARSHFQSTPLHFACEHGFIEIVRCGWRLARPGPVRSGPACCGSVESTIDYIYMEGGRIVLVSVVVRGRFLEHFFREPGLGFGLL